MAGMATAESARYRVRRGVKLWVESGRHGNAAPRCANHFNILF
jgi:hypothetical protein